MPRYGFNFLWMYFNPAAGPEEPDENALDFLARQGFDFVRLPLNYWYWTRDFNYYAPDEKVLAFIDRYVQACRQRGLHVNLNLHRAPGYCCNDNHLEKHNLWKDAAGQDAFVWLWQHFATRYQDVPSADLSFDLLNEPPGIRVYGMNRKNHAAIMRRTAAAIRAVTPQREIVIDGLGWGNIAMPELADLGAVHSTRGYQPMPVSHYQATWWSDWQRAPAPKYPGVRWARRTWNRKALEKHYAPWRKLEAQGVRVHIGEFGCYNKTPNDVALRWFADLLGLFGEYGWGYSMWNFEGAFGVVNHGRPGAVYEDYEGYKVDRALLNLLLENRVQ